VQIHLDRVFNRGIFFEEVVVSERRIVQGLGVEGLVNRG
jgi:hypothetical protein